MSLPKFVVLKSITNDKYLRYRHENGPLHGFVQCSGDEEWSPYAKFEVVKANYRPDRIHLKCCFNNKYLSIWKEDFKWIVAGADQPNEDAGGWTSTMFTLSFDRIEPRMVRFNDSLGYNYVSRGWDAGYTNCVRLNNDGSNSAFTYVDWETIVPPKPKNCNIKVGAWGGSEGETWSFEAEGEGGITKIIIEYKDIINAVSFEVLTADGGTESSPPFGGDGGIKREIKLEWEKGEYLKSIKGTYDTLDSESQVITSLEFKTNKGKKIGPFGKKDGTAFAMKMKRGAIVGFHGRKSDSFIEAIGIFTRHVDHKEH